MPFTDGRVPRFADGGAVASTISLPASANAATAGQRGAPQVNIHVPVTVNATGGTPAQNEELAKQMGAQFERIARGAIVEELRTQMRRQSSKPLIKGSDVDASASLLN